MGRYRPISASSPGMVGIMAPRRRAPRPIDRRSQIGYGRWTVKFSPQFDPKFGQQNRFPEKIDRK